MPKIKRIGINVKRLRVPYEGGFVLTSLKGAIRALRVTKNVWNLPALILLPGKKNIVFRNNSSALKLNRDEFLILKEAVSQGYHVELLSNGMFHITNSTHELTIGTDLLPRFQSMTRNEHVRVQPIGPDVFRIETSEFTLEGSYGLFYAVFVDDQPVHYQCDCLGKTVLDVGGFQGESAVFFSRMGAKKIVIYEPVVDHHRFIRRNIALNNVNAEVYEEGIGDEDGVQVVNCETLDVSVGVFSHGLKELTLKIRSAKKVLEESQADIAKIDCEGAEVSLVNVPNSTLRRIDYYIIEVHTKQIRDLILAKFKDAGFTKLRETECFHILFRGVQWDISTIHLKRLP